MVNFTSGVSRQLISIEFDKLQQLIEDGTVILNTRRSRPRYFDGRFLSAQDLIRDQEYFLSRQADLAKVGGFGVVHGLWVTGADGSGEILIYAGHGITPSGELVVVPEDLPPIDLTRLEKRQIFDASFGLARIPGDPIRNATGLFVIALRPVEYTANPIPSYPTSMIEPRSLKDGDIIEAVAVTLIPYNDVGTGDWQIRRARVAHEIFVNGSMQGVLTDALPLAIVALENGRVQWVDPFLVRREVGTEQASILLLANTPRALREAHVHQYNQQLQDLVRNLQQQSFSAATYFRALPPVGMLPAASIDVSMINAPTISQIYFPPDMQVDLSVIPIDEIPGLVEESVLLPPIDLTASPEELASIAILVLIPTPRSRVNYLKASLPTLSQEVLPLDNRSVGQQSPLDRLQALQARRKPILPRTPIDQRNWETEISSTPWFWYVRKRHFPYTWAAPSQPIRIYGDERLQEKALSDALAEKGLHDQVNQLREGATAAANADMVNLLSGATRKQPILLKAVVHELELAKSNASLDQSAVLKIADRFSDPNLGTGIERLEQVEARLRENPEIANTLAQSNRLPELDQLVRSLPDADLSTFAEQLVAVAQTGNPTEVAELITRKLRGKR